METILILLAALLGAAVLAFVVVVARGRETAKRVAAETRLAEAEAQNATLATRLEGAEAPGFRPSASSRRCASSSARRTAAPPISSGCARRACKPPRRRVLETAQELSSKLLDDHKRENDAAKKEAEERVRQTSDHLVKQVEEIAKAVAALNGQVQDKARLLDTVWRSLVEPGRRRADRRDRPRQHAQGLRPRDGPRLSCCSSRRKTRRPAGACGPTRSCSCPPTAPW